MTLSEREENEAYCMAIPGEEYALYFPGQGEVMLNAEPGEYEVRWLQIRSSHRSEPDTIELPGMVHAPVKDQWAVFLKKL